MTSNDIPYFAFVEDPARNFLRATLSGHWDVSVVGAFEKEARLAMCRVAGGDGSNTLVLKDARESGVQSQTVAQRLQMLASDLPTKRTAVLIRSMLHKLQADRINPVDYHCVFDHEDAALKWLLNPELDSSAQS